MVKRGSPERVQTLEHRGWEILRLRNDALEVDILPGKGADILQVRWLPLGLDLLWRAPWGVRARGAVPTAADTHTNIIENYPGGWQTVFPNGGRSVVAYGVEHGFHGEAWLAPWDWNLEGEILVLSTRLVRSPFRLTKRLALDGARLVLEETAHNEGRQRFEAMWSQHPAFGASFLEGGCRLETAASSFAADEELVRGDLEPGRESRWPYAAGRGGASVDLRVIPDEGAGIERLGYLTGFDGGWASVENPRLGLRAELDWDPTLFPYAWLWLDADGSDGFPFYRSCYVMAIEPSSSFPGRGMEAVRQTTGTLLPFEPGEARTLSMSLTLRET